MEIGYELRETSEKGEGIYATQPYKVGDTVMIGVIKEVLTRNHSHASQIDEHTHVLHDGLISKVNHCCEPNCGIHVNETGAHDFVAMRNIGINEEATFDYAMRNYSIDHFPKVCMCGAKKCRGKITGWKDLTTEYKLKCSQLSSRQYGFIPDQQSLLTSFTYMFMHGSTGHLLGNMIFLWIVGCMLEMGLGRLQYSVLYLVGGLFAVWFFWLIYMSSTIPLVGASGAIAGLMGAFAVLFGKKKVKIFYSLGFYFNYLKIPAIILLPIWIGNELYQLFGSGATHVAYGAHIGGLVGGAVFGIVCLKFSLGFNQDVIVDTLVDDISPQIEKALKHIAELDLETGRRILEKVLAREPENIDALTHLFNAYKLEPEDEKFHRVTKKLLFELTRSYNTYEKAHQIYNEYIRTTNHPRLSSQIYIQLSMMFAAMGHLENAVTILTMLLKKVPDSPGVPTALLKLARAYRQKGMAMKGKRCLNLICNKYPESTEAQLAHQSLQSSYKPGAPVKSKVKGRELGGDQAYI